TVGPDLEVVHSQSSAPTWVLSPDTIRIKIVFYVPIGQDPINEKLTEVPKGHLAIYIGQKDGDYHRVLVPVIYFNHPLFGELLREAEEEYGFSHQGGITIPCRFSEFERVQ
ncbi:hypothetical protein Godav_011888, partial [Gossypium davidsonii]|nr:hypothetical protein [Gossypium davidsonii]MBA0646303.1 hypothetical protein [Gossypium klotzschianum]